MKMDEEFEGTLFLMEDFKIEESFNKALNKLVEISQDFSKYDKEDCQEFKKN